MTTQAPPRSASESVWSTPLPSTSVLPSRDRHLIRVIAWAVTVAAQPSAETRVSTTWTAQEADLGVRPVRRPRSAAPAATRVSVRASVLPGTTRAPRAAAGSAATTAAARALRYAVAASAAPPPVTADAAPLWVSAAAGAAAASVAAATATVTTMCAQCRLFILTPFWRVTGWRRRR